MSKMLSLDELAELTRKQQEEEESGMYDIIDGKRVKRVNTTDLTSDDTNPNPYENIMEGMMSYAPIVEPGQEITMEDNRSTEMYRPAAQQKQSVPIAAKQSLKPVAIPDIAAYKPVKKVGEEHMNDLVSKLDQAIERDKQQMWNNVVSPLYEKLEEEKIYGSDDSDGPELTDVEPQSEEDFMAEDKEDDFGFPIPKSSVRPIKADDFFKDEENDITEESAPEIEMSDFYDDNKEEAASATDALYEEENKGDQEDMNEDNVIQPNNEIPEEYPRLSTEVNHPVEELVAPKKEEVKPVIASVTVRPAEKKPLKTPLDDMITGMTGKTIETSLTAEEGTDLDSLQDSDLDDYFERADREDDDYELTEEEKKENLDEIKKIVKTEVRPVSNIINLSEYSISSKATTTSKVLSEIGQTKNVYSANWCLYNIGRPFTMTGYDGAEIDKLNPSAETGLEELARMKELYGIFYDHIIDSNKPTTFDAWAKTIPYDDIDHLYFGAYRSSFGNGSNLVPHICLNPKCKHQFMEHHTMDQMVKFKDDAAKNRLKTILNMDPTGEKFNIKSKLYQVTDTICIAFRTPTLYSVVFERITLPQKFRDKFSDLVFYINCIEGIYKIDRNSKQLIPMKPKVEVQNIVKTTQNKYKAYAAVLQQLTSDQYYSIPAYIRDMREDHTEDLKYIIPESTCPKCGHKVEEKEMTGMELLFTRHHLQTVLVL